MFYSQNYLIFSQKYVIILIKGGLSILFSIAIFSDQYQDVQVLKSTIQDFLIEHRKIAKVSYFNDPELLLMAPSRYDVYIMDMDAKDNVIHLANKIKTVDMGSHYVYMSSKDSDAILATKARCDYFILKPLEVEEIMEILKEIKLEIQEDNIIIKTATGERKIRANRLNYINIVKRCLCYHLDDGTMFDGQALRSSFQKAITPLDQHKAFLFVAPSLLINIGAIKEVNKDNIVFENDEVLFFPMTQYNKIREAWIGYTRIIE